MKPEQTHTFETEMAEHMHAAQQALLRLPVDMPVRVDVHKASVLTMARSRDSMDIGRTTQLHLTIAQLGQALIALAMTSREEHPQEVASALRDARQALDAGKSCAIRAMGQVTAAQVAKSINTSCELAPETQGLSVDGQIITALGKQSQGMSRAELYRMCDFAQHLGDLSLALHRLLAGRFVVDLGGRYFLTPKTEAA